MARGASVQSGGEPRARADGGGGGAGIEGASVGVMDPFRPRSEGRLEVVRVAPLLAAPSTPALSRLVLGLVASLDLLVREDALPLPPRRDVTGLVRLPSNADGRLACGFRCKLLGPPRIPSMSDTLVSETLA